MISARDALLLMLTVSQLCFYFFEDAHVVGLSDFRYSAMVSDGVWPDYRNINKECK